MPISSNSTLANQFIPDFRIKNLTDGQFLVYNQTKKAFVNTDGSDVTVDINVDDIPDYFVKYNHLIASEGQDPTAMVGRVLSVAANGEMAWVRAVDTSIPIGLVSLDELMDVDLSGNVNVGDLLVYEQDGIWRSVTLTLDTTTDVLYTGSPLDKQALMFDGVNWTNKSLQMTDIEGINTDLAPSAGDVLYYTNQWNVTPLVLSSLGDVSDLSVKNDRDVLTWNEGLQLWSSANILEALVLNDLTDVVIDIPGDISSDHILSYDYQLQHWKNIELTYDKLLNIPSNFQPTEHTHYSSDILDFDDAVLNKNNQFTFKLLQDSGTPVNAGFMKWDEGNDRVNYVTTLASTLVTNDSIVVGETVTESLNTLDERITNISADIGDSKIDKVIGARANNIAIFLAEGGIYDSGFATYNFATAAQGALAETATQPNSPISNLDNDIGYITGISTLSITDLVDVSMSIPANKDILSWDIFTSEWVPVSAQEAFADVDIQLTELSDVEIDMQPGDPVNGKVLMYNEGTTTWVNSYVNYADLLDPPSIPTNNDFTFASLSDTSDTVIPYGFLRWDQTGTEVISSDTITVNYIEGLATVATTGDYMDLSSHPVPGVDFAAVYHEHSKAEILDFDEADYATAIQGLLADSALQPGDMLSELNNDVGYLTDIGSLQLSDLSDVSTSVPVVDQILAWDSILAAWTPTDIATLLPSINLSLDELSNVDVSAVADNQVLAYDSNTATWGGININYNDVINKPTSFAPLPHTSDLVTDFDDQVITNNNRLQFKLLSDIGTPVSGYMVWNGSTDAVAYATTIPVASVIGLEAVALTGDYADLYNVPVIPKNTDFNFINLSDTNNTILSNGYLKWNSNGTQIAYVSTIPVNDVTGLATVAISGSYNNLFDKPAIPTNSQFKVTGLMDTHAVPVANGFFRWDSTGDMTTYQPRISIDDIDGLSPVAAGGSYNDLYDKPTTVSWNIISDKPTKFQPVQHYHVIGDVTGLQSELDKKMNAGDGFNGDYNSLTNKPVIPNNVDFTFRELSDTNGVPVANGFLRWNSTGTQVKYDVTISSSVVSGLSLVAKTNNYLDLNNRPTTMTPTQHNHPVAEISGIDAYALKTSISTVGKTNNYNDLDNLPDLSSLTQYTFLELLDTSNVSIPNGYVKWDVTGTNLIYSATIPVTTITGLAPVAISGTLGSINDVDLTDVEAGDGLLWNGTVWTPANYVNTIVKLDDVTPVSTASGYLRWNTTGTTVVFEKNIDVQHITGLASVATTADIFDLVNVHANANTIAAGQILVWDGTSAFIPQYVDVGVDGEGITTIYELQDTLIDNANGNYSNGQVLTIQGTIGIGTSILPLWVNKRLSLADLEDAPTNATYSLSELYDTSNNPIANGFLRWDSSANIVEYQASILANDIIGLGTVAYTNAYADIDGRIENIGDLIDVADTAPSTGNLLIWDGTNGLWTPGDLSLAGVDILLENLANVTVTSPTIRQALVYDGSIWVNKTISVDDIDGLATVAYTGDYTDLINLPELTVTALDDTADIAVFDGFLRWNGDGSQVIYVEIDSSDINNLATVGITGDYDDLVNTPTIPTNSSFTLYDLSDTDTSRLSNSYLIWDDAGTMVEYQQYPPFNLFWNKITDSTTLVANKSYFLSDLVLNPIISLPLTPVANDYVDILDRDGLFSTYPCTIEGNGEYINGSIESYILSSDRTCVRFTYIDDTQGWVFTNSSNADFGTAAYPPVWQVVSGSIEGTNIASYMVNTTGAQLTFTLPPTPVKNSQVILSDYAGTFRSNPLTVNRNGNLINGLAEDVVLGRKHTTATFSYVDEIVGWRLATAISSISESDITWEIVNSDVQASDGDGLFIDTTNDTVIVTLPPIPAPNDIVKVADLFGTSDINRILVAGNGKPIMNNMLDLEITNSNASIELTYVNDSFGWKITDGLGELVSTDSKINSAYTLYVSTTGSDDGAGSIDDPYLTLGRALISANELIIGISGSITINIGAGVHVNTESVYINHITGDRLYIVGEQVTSPVNIVGLGPISGSSIQINTDSVTGLSVGDYVRITEVAGTGNVKFIEGVFKIDSVGVNSITINPSYSQTPPTGIIVVSGIITKHDTVLLFNNSNGIIIENRSVGLLNNMVIAGNSSVTDGLVIGSLNKNSNGSAILGNKFSIHGFGNSGLVIKNQSYATSSNLVISRCKVGVDILAGSLVSPGALITHNLVNGIIINSGNAALLNSNISSNGQGALVKNNGFLEAKGATMAANLLSACRIEYGGVIDATTATINGTNNATGTGTTFEAFGSGAIRVENTGTGNISNATFNPAYGTMDVPTNGTAYIGNV